MIGKGVNRLARSIERRARKVSDVPPSLDLGVIDANGNLLLDQFDAPIPRGGYLVSLWTLDALFPTVSRLFRSASPVEPDGGDNQDTSYSSLSRMDFEGGDSDGHVPDIELTQSLKTGDRVLVAWVRSEPVVISKVVSSDA